MSSSNKPLSIGFYAPALPESGVSNGIVTYTGIMRDALRALGHSVTIVTVDHVERADGSAIDLPKSRGIMRRLRALAESRNQSDGLYASHRLPVLEAFDAALRAGVDVFEIEESFGWAGRFAGRGPAIIERLHGPHALLRQWSEPSDQRPNGDLRAAAELASFTKVDAVTAPTQALIDELRVRYGIEIPVARAIPNPMPVPPQSLHWRPENADPDQLLFIGRFDQLKGADVALRAFARALEQRPTLRLIMVGPDFGLNESGRPPVHFDEFVAREFPPEVRERVRFLGTQPPECVSELRLQSGFSILTSQFENFPYSIAEAMAVGMPVLASDTFGARALIRDRIDGLIVPKGDIAATAQAMIELAGNREQLASMGRSAQARVANWLSPEAIARQTVGVYREALLLRQRTGR